MSGREVKVSKSIKGLKLSSGSDSGRWFVIKKLGEGQFAEVYEVRDTFIRDRDVRYAVKIEKRKDVKSVRPEFKVLQRLQEQHVPAVCESIVTGTHDERFFIIMELLGPNLAELRRMNNNMYNRAIVRCIGLSTLTSLQGVHEAGYLHRDVKPANFVLFPPGTSVLQGTWKIIDFGLARRFTDESGGVLAQRADASFRGSTTYASIHAHQELDLGRRDDLWSWLYCMVELLDGTLPWRADAAAAGATGRDGEVGPSTNGKDLRERVQELKEQCILQPTLLFRNVQPPEVFCTISNYINSLEFADTPDYNYIRSCLAQIQDVEPEPSNCGWENSLQQIPHIQQAVVGSYDHAMTSDVIMQDYNVMNELPKSPSHDTPKSPVENGVVWKGSRLGHAQGSGPVDVWPSSSQDWQHQQEPRRKTETTHFQAPDSMADVQKAWVENSVVEAAREARAALHMSEAAAAVRHGLLSPEAQALHKRLGALPPAEVLAVAAAMIQDAYEAVDPSCGNILAIALHDLSLFTRHIAKQADTRFLEWDKRHRGAAPPGS